MLGFISRRYFYAGFWSCNYFCHVPYRWDTERKIAVPKNDIAGYTGWIINIFILLVSQVWGTVRTFQSFSQVDGTFQSHQYCVFTTVLTISLPVALLIQIDQVRCHKDMLIIYNQFIQYCDRFKGNSENKTFGKIS
ncbi:unnamed protein product, partial [Allacma fusca]